VAETGFGQVDGSLLSLKWTQPLPAIHAITTGKNSIRFCRPWQKVTQTKETDFNMFKFMWPPYARSVTATN
jgi:hypothetical protein